MPLIDREDETTQLTNFLEEAVKSKNSPKTTISYNISIKNWKIEDLKKWSRLSAKITMPNTILISKQILIVLKHKEGI